ncbi:tyrosine-type recombinase/integrase [Litoribacterium kuwaitense]|uniref:tyrosine-type recombinase/integrase n=1 Tax=Litoribacterium kuwaitense TaxID=1398745 RepID=UPI001BA6D21F|nr:tyrosine-type recombinase/integrase [Litoribacterium kuwaitense]
MVRRRNKLDDTILQKTDAAAVEDYESAVSLFLRELKVRNRSEYTVKYYARELLKAGGMLERAGVDTSPERITAKDIKTHIILRMMDEKRKDTTVNARLRALRAFFNYLVDEKLIKESPFNTVSLVTQQSRYIESFTKEQMRALLAAPAKETFTGVRDYTIMLIMLETGVRLRELTEVSLKDIQWADDSAIKVHGKGAKDRLLPIQSTVKRELRRYVAVRGELHHDTLFVNIDNKPVSRRAIQTAIHKYGVLAGISNVRCSPHTLRHTFAKMSVQNGADTFTLQKILGHETLDMVRRYVNFFSKDLAVNHKKFSPVERLF